MTVVDRLNVHHDDNNAHVWREAAGEHEGADVLWTLDFAPVQGYAEGRARGLRGDETHAEFTWSTRLPEQQ